MMILMIRTDRNAACIAYLGAAFDLAPGGCKDKALQLRSQVTRQNPVRSCTAVEIFKNSLDGAVRIKG